MAGFSAAGLMLTHAAATAEEPVRTSVTEIGVSCANARPLAVSQVAGNKEERTAEQLVTSIVTGLMPRLNGGDLAAVQTTVYQTSKDAYGITQVGIAVTDPDDKSRTIAAVHLHVYDGLGPKLQRATICQS